MAEGFKLRPGQPTKTDPEDSGEGVYQKRDNVVAVVGKGSQGKSTLINSFCEITGDTDVMAKAKHDGKTTTKEVTKYIAKLQNGTICFIDTPGFLSRGISDDTIIENLSRVSGRRADLLLYCTSLGKSSRIDGADTQIVEKLTNKFGKDIWRRTILVLKFADECEQKEGCDALGYKNLRELAENYADAFQECLQECRVDIQVKSSLSGIPDGFKGIRAVPAAEDKTTPIPYVDKDWFKTLMDTILLQCSNESLPQLLLLIRPEWTSVLKTGAGCGAAGAVLGAGVGAGVGAALVGAPTLGVGAPVGFGIGAAVGALAGSTGATFLSSLIHFRVVPAVKEWKIRKKRVESDSAQATP